MTVNHKDDQVAAAAIHSLEYLIFRGLQPFQVFIKYVLSFLILKLISSSGGGYWSDHIVPFSFSSSVSLEDRKVIYQRMKDIEQHSCVQEV